MYNFFFVADRYVFCYVMMSTVKIIIFRLLAASLNYRETPKWHVDKVRMIAAQCNKQKYNAKKASELSTEMYTLKYIERNSPVVTDAAVVEVREKYIDVIIIAMGLNRRIFFNNVSYQNIFEHYLFYGIKNICYL